MAGLAVFFWLRLARWLDGKGLQTISTACYRYVMLAGGVRGDEAMLLLGNRLFAAHRFVDAQAFYEQALEAHPDNARAWCGLGAAHRQLAEMDAARRCYERALELAPDYLQAQTNLGEWHLVTGDVQQALTYFDQVLGRDARFYEALANRVVALAESDRLAEAETAARAAIEHYPDSAPLHVNLGNVLVHTGRGRPGLVAYRKALELDPGNEEASYNLAILQCDFGALPQATAFIKREIEVKGATADRLVTLATAQKAAHQVIEAENTCRDVLRRHPDHVSALVLVASCASAKGEPVQAIEYFEQAVAARPDMAAIYSNVLFESNYLAELPAEDLFRRHRDWAARYERPLMTQRLEHPRSTEPERRLRIGYVSGDYCNHPVGSLFRDVVLHHDRAVCEIHCFSNFLVADAVTEKIRSAADCWHDIALLPDAEIAALIRRQGIDILVDLSGHTAFNRLQVFAVKPAPVQATWIGYFHSTGLEAIDYFITDPHTSPAGIAQCFSEVPVHLPHTRFCYAPPDYVPEVAAAPAARNGYVTFGSFNRLSKITDPVVEAWSAVLRQVPTAKLLIKTRGVEDPVIAGRLLERFAAQGIAAERLILRPSGGHLPMFKEYGDIDVALDTFPFNGGLTTMEALWMGVPVLTVAGSSVVSRQSAAMLLNVGLDDLVCADTDAFVRRAAELAAAPEHLAALRGDLRQRMASSPLRQPERFARDLEQLYRRMWHAWCDGTRLPDATVSVAKTGARFHANAAHGRAKA